MPWHIRLERLHHYSAQGWRARLERGVDAACPYRRGHLRTAWWYGFLSASRYLAERRALEREGTRARWTAPGRAAHALLLDGSGRDDDGPADDEGHRPAA